MYETPDCYRSVQLGTPRKSLLADDSLTEVDEDGEDSCSITVAVRVRPYSQRYVDFFVLVTNVDNFMSKKTTHKKPQLSDDKNMNSMFAIKDNMK
jgi:hypothetical protein